MKITINLRTIAKYTPYACLIALAYPLWNLSAADGWLAYGIVLVGFFACMIDGGYMGLEQAAAELHELLEEAKRAEKEK